VYTHTAVLNRLNLVLDYPLAGSGYLVLGTAVYMAVYTHVYTAVSTRSARGYVYLSTPGTGTGTAYKGSPLRLRGHGAMNYRKPACIHMLHHIIPGF